MDCIWEAIGFDNAFLDRMKRELMDTTLDVHVDDICIGTRPNIPSTYAHFPPYYKDSMELNTWKGNIARNLSKYELSNSKHPLFNHICAASRREEFTDIFEVNIPVTFLVRKNKHKIALTYSVGVFRLRLIYPGHPSHPLMHTSHEWKARGIPHTFYTHDLFTVASLVRLPLKIDTCGAILAFAYVHARTHTDATHAEYVRIVRSLVEIVTDVPHMRLIHAARDRTYARVEDIFARLATRFPDRITPARRAMAHVARILLEDAETNNTIDVHVTMIDPQSLEDERF